MRESKEQGSDALLFFAAKNLQKFFLFV